MLRVMGISYSQLQHGAYALILGQVDGPYRIPVVIGAPEAQAIAVKMESIAMPRPMTHDLFSTFCHGFGVELKEVLIYKFEDGIFYSSLTLADHEREVVIDARTSDAIAIAMRMHAPIFTTPEIIAEAGFIFENEGGGGESEDRRDAANEEEADSVSLDNLENLSIEQLEGMLGNLIDEERYEDAAKVSEVLNRKRGNNLPSPE